MISLLCPTRGRPHNMTRFAESAITLAEDPAQVEIVFYLDEDDTDSIATARALREDGVHGRDVIGPRIVLSSCWNRCAEQALGDVLGHMGDDIVFRTGHWDSLVESAFENYDDRICFVHGRDGLQDERLGTHGFVSRRWVDTVGYFTAPHFAHDYADTWLNEVALAIGRHVYLPGLLTEHLHPDAGKAPLDQTYREHAEAGRRANVAALYASLAHERRSDAEKLRAVIAR